MTENFLPYGRQCIQQGDIQAAGAQLLEPLITRGPKVEAFERAVADYCGVEFAVAFSSGTAALQACYFAGEVSPHDRILSSPNTFFASVIGVGSGAKAEFIDIDRTTGCLSLEKLSEQLALPATRGKSWVVPVHFAGIAVDMVDLEESIADPTVVTIEDAAHAIGSSYPSGEKVGCCSYSDMTVFSFHPVKTLTTGEGGMVTTHDQKLYERLRLFRNNGIVPRPDIGPWAYEVQAITGNFHLTDFQAALGLAQLERLDATADKRRELVSEYRKNLEGVQLFDKKHDDNTCYHLMVAQIDFERVGRSRAEVMEALREKGVGTQVHYVPVYKHPVIQNGSKWEKECPQMEAYYEQALTLPLYPEMTTSDVRRVSEAVSEVLAARV